jgi:hypothetical protein
LLRSLNGVGFVASRWVKVGSTGVTISFDKSGLTGSCSSSDDNVRFRPFVIILSCFVPLGIID